MTSPRITIWSTYRGKRHLTKKHTVTIAEVFNDLPHLKECRECRKGIAEEVALYVEEMITGRNDNRKL